MVGEAWKAATEATLMIAPPWPRCGIAARQLRKTARRLSETILSQPSVLMAATGAVKREPPATLISTSSRPVASTARATAASTAASSVTSVVTTSASGAPNERAAAATFSSSAVERAASTTAAPALAMVRAACSPIPRLAPVISAVLPRRPKSGAAATAGSSLAFRIATAFPPQSRTSDSTRMGGGASRACSAAEAGPGSRAMASRWAEGDAAGVWHGFTRWRAAPTTGRRWSSGQLGLWHPDARSHDDATDPARPGRARPAPGPRPRRRRAGRAGGPARRGRAVARRPGPRGPPGPVRPGRRGRGHPLGQDRRLPGGLPLLLPVRALRDQRPPHRPARPGGRPQRRARDGPHRGQRVLHRDGPAGSQLGGGRPGAGGDRADPRGDWPQRGGKPRHPRPRAGPPPGRRRGAPLQPQPRGGPLVLPADRHHPHLGGAPADLPAGGGGRHGAVLRRAARHGRGQFSARRAARPAPRAAPRRGAGEL